MWALILYLSWVWYWRIFPGNAPELNSTVQVCTLWKRKGFYVLPILLRNLFSEHEKNLWLQIKVPCWIAFWFTSHGHGRSWKWKIMQINSCAACDKPHILFSGSFHCWNPIFFTLLFKYNTIILRPSALIKHVPST